MGPQLCLIRQVVGHCFQVRLQQPLEQPPSAKSMTGGDLYTKTVHEFDDHLQLFQHAKYADWSMQAVKCSEGDVTSLHSRNCFSKIVLLPVQSGAT